MANTDATTVSQKYPRVPEAISPTSSIHAAATAAPITTADGRTGCGSRNVGRGGPDGKSPEGGRDSTLETLVARLDARTGLAGFAVRHAG